MVHGQAAMRWMKLHKAELMCVWLQHDGTRRAPRCRNGCVSLWGQWPRAALLDTLLARGGRVAACGRPLFGVAGTHPAAFFENSIGLRCGTAVPVYYQLPDSR
eukprot:COSAG01_NODE_25005_length_758_cov_7.033384_2_plen_103_part_00